MKKSEFLDCLQHASRRYGELSAGKKGHRSFIHDGDILSASKYAGIEATGTLANCAISRAIVVCHESRNTLEILAAAEAAWEQHEAIPSQQKVA